MASEQQCLDPSPEVRDGPLPVNSHGENLGTDPKLPPSTEAPGVKVNLDCSAQKEQQGAAEPLPSLDTAQNENGKGEEHEIIQEGSTSNEQGIGQERENREEHESSKESGTEQADGEKQEKTEEGESGKDKDGASSKDQDGASSKDQDGASSKDQDEISSKDQDGASSKDQDGTSSKDQDGTSSNNQDGASSNNQDGASRNNQEGACTTDIRDKNQEGTWEKDQERASSKDQDENQVGTGRKAQATGQVGVIIEVPETGEQGHKGSNVQRQEEASQLVLENEEANKSEHELEQEKTGGEGQKMGEEETHWAIAGLGSETISEGVTGIDTHVTGVKGTSIEGEGQSRVGVKETGDLRAEQVTETAAETVGDQSKNIGEGQPGEDQGPQETMASAQHEGDDAQIIDTAESTGQKETATHLTETAGDRLETGEEGTGEEFCSGVTRGWTGTDEKVSPNECLIPHEQVTLQRTGTGEQVMGSNVQVSGGDTVRGEEEGIEVYVREEGTGVQVTGEDSGDSGCISWEGTEEQAGTASLQDAVEEFAGESGTEEQVSASGEKTEREVTPDPASGEGTAEPDRPAACWERECPSLKCTSREVRADRTGQGETQQEKVSEEEQPLGMKDRESVDEGEISAPETPIEREIRLTMEREQDLRQERGISLPVGQQELVEVRRKSVKGEPGPPAGKERQLAGAQMQREIQLDTRREQDLVQLGKVIGGYDRGAQQQELQERKMMFESFASVSPEPSTKKRQSVPPQLVVVDGPIYVAPIASNHVSSMIPTSKVVKKGPSYTEANGSNVILIEQSSLLRRSVPANYSAPAPTNFPRSTQVDSPQSVPGTPFQVLRSPSPRSLLEREIEEVRERERELQRQRSSVYGRDESLEDASEKEPENRGDIQSGIYQPERPSWRRLDVNWPPNPDVTTNGQQAEQSTDSPRTRRQRSALIQSWESGTPNPLDEQ
ncbi:uncharacterized protein MISP3 [Pelodytes ibericus]